jgi:glycerate kinase
VKIILAPDSFKESLTAIQVADALERGIGRVLSDCECVKIPIADGGEGTVEALIRSTNGRRIRKKVSGPLGTPVYATYGILGGGTTAVIEMAAASGLQLIANKDRDPLRATTLGTGQLIRAAVTPNIRRLIVGAGGSATNDAGIGMAQGLGIKMLDAGGALLRSGLGGGDLDKIACIDATARLAGLNAVEVLVACDVHNPLVGRFGASTVYGPQKGGRAADISVLERNLRHVAKLIRRDLKIGVAKLERGGAGGGLAAGLVAFASAKLMSGIELVLESVEFDAQLRDADLVITAEGRVDSQTSYGKAPAGVAAAAARFGVPVVALGGALSSDARKIFANGFDALESSIVRDCSLDEALDNARANVCDAGERIAKWLTVGQRIASRRRTS